MKNPLVPVAREIRKLHPEMPKGFVLTHAGSFLSMRIEDPEGLVTVKAATTAVEFVGRHAHKMGLVAQIVPLQGFAYHFGGVVATWERN